MSKVSIETKPVIAKPVTNSVHDVVSVLAKGEATENAAKKKRQGVLRQRATCTVELAGFNTGKTHYGLDIANDKPLTWRALLDFAENGAPIVRDPVAALIEAFEKLEPEQAEEVITFFKTEFSF